MSNKTIMKILMFVMIFTISFNLNHSTVINHEHKLYKRFKSATKSIFSKKIIGSKQSKRNTSLNTIFSSESIGLIGREIKSESLIIDSFDNVYITGTINGSYPGNIYQGLLDGFILMKNSNSITQWFKTFGSADDDQPKGLCKDKFNNIFITGNTKDSFTFPSITHANPTFFGVFILKYNSSGFIVGNIKSAPGVDLLSSKCSVDSFGNIYVVGNELPIKRGFIIKYDQNLNEISTDYFDLSPNQIEFYNIAINRFDNIFITGKQLTFPNFLFIANINQYIDNNTSDVIITPFYFILVPQRVTAAIGEINNIHIDSNDNIFICGRVTQLGSNFKMLVPAGIADGFFSKIIYYGNNQFSSIFTNLIGTELSDKDYPLSITTDQFDNIHIVGYLEPTGPTYFIQELLLGLRSGFYVVHDNCGKKIKGYLIEDSSALEETLSDIKINSTGKIYLTGYYNSPNLKGAIRIGDIDSIIINPGFINNNSNLIIKYFGGQTFDDNIGDLVINSNNDAIIVGRTKATQSSLTNVLIECIPYKNTTAVFDGFIYGTNNEFNRKFIKTIGTPGPSNLNKFNSITNDLQDNIYVCGDTNTNIFTSLNTLGNINLIFAKYDKEGNLLIGKQFLFNAICNKIILDGTNKIIIVGKMYETYLDQVNNGLDDALILVLDQLGNIITLKQFGTSNSDEIFDIKLDLNDDLYVVGKIGDTFNSMIFNGSDDGFLAKINRKTWNIEFTKSIGTTGSDMYKSLIMDSEQNIYVLGFIGNSLNGHILMGTSDCILSKYTHSGNLFFTKFFGSTGTDQCNEIRISSKKELFVIGSANGVIDGVTTLSDDIFIAGFSTCGHNFLTKIIGETYQDIGKRIIIKDQYYYALSETKNHNIFGYSSPKYRTTKDTSILLIRDIICQFYYNGNCYNCPANSYFYQGVCLTICPNPEHFTCLNYCIVCNGATDHFYNDECVSKISCPNQDHITINKVCKLCTEPNDHFYNNECVSISNCPNPNHVNSNKKCFECSGLTSYFEKSTSLCVSLNNCPNINHINSNNVCFNCTSPTPYFFYNSCVSICIDGIINLSTLKCSCIYPKDHFYINKCVELKDCPNENFVTSIDECLNCLPPNDGFKNNYCFNNNYCSDNSIVTLNNICLKCNSPFKYVIKNGIYLDNCVETCHIGYELKIINGKETCYFTCQKGQVFENNLCLSKCYNLENKANKYNICEYCGTADNGLNSDFKYLDLIKNECTLIDLCTNKLQISSNIFVCKCNKDEVLLNNECIKSNTCNKYHYLDENRICKKCPDSGIAEVNKYIYLKGNTCVEKCEQPYVTKMESNFFYCELCGSSNKFYSNGKCVDECSESYELKLTNNEWLCVDKCPINTVVENKTCVNCGSLNKFIEDNKCVDSCLTNNYDPNTKVCISNCNTKEGFFINPFAKKKECMTCFNYDIIKEEKSCIYHECKRSYPENYYKICNSCNLNANKKVIETFCIDECPDSSYEIVKIQNEKICRKIYLKDNCDTEYCSKNGECFINEFYKKECKCFKNFYGFKCLYNTEEYEMSNQKFKKILEKKNSEITIIEYNEIFNLLNDLPDLINNENIYFIIDSLLSDEVSKGDTFYTELDRILYEKINK